MVNAQGKTAEKIKRICAQLPGCSFVSLSERQVHAFESLRQNLLWALLAAIVSIFIVLFFRYGSVALKLILVPVLSVLTGLAAIAWLGFPVTAFTMASMFPLLGLSIDYVVFARESRGHPELTEQAIFASAVTTTVAFAILSFSETPAVKFFAIPIAVGIPMAWIMVQSVQLNRD